MHLHSDIAVCFGTPELTGRRSILTSVIHLQNW